MKKVLILFSLMLLTISVRSQTASVKEWTLQECIEQALKSNIRVQQARLNARNAKELLTQSYGQALPDLNASASHIYNYGRTIDPFTNTFANDKVLSQNFSIGSNLNLFSGFRTINSISQARFSYFAAEQEIKKIENDIALAVASSYLQILFNTELMQISQRQLMLTGDQVRRTEKLVNAGSLAVGALYDIKAQQAMEEYNQVNAENQLQLSALELTQLMNLEPEKAAVFRIQIPILEIPSGPSAVTIDQAYLAAVQGMPQIKGAEFKVKSGEKQLSVARASLSPSLMVSGSLGSGYSGANKEIDEVTFSSYDTTGITASGVPVLSPRFNYSYKGKPFKEQLDDNFNRSVGFRLTVPLFNNFDTRTSIQRAKISLSNEQLNLQQVKLDLRKDVQKAYLEATAALKKYNAATKAVEAMQQSFKFTQQRFDVGAINVFEFSTGKTTLAKSESDLAQAKYEYLFKLKVLDFYQGKPFTF